MEDKILRIARNRKTAKGRPRQPPVHEHHQHYLSVWRGAQTDRRTHAVHPLLGLQNAAPAKRAVAHRAAGHQGEALQGREDRQHTHRRRQDRDRASGRENGGAHVEKGEKAGAKVLRGPGQDDDTGAERSVRAGTGKPDQLPVEVVPRTAVREGPGPGSRKLYAAGRNGSVQHAQRAGAQR